MLDENQPQTSFEVDKGKRKKKSEKADDEDTVAAATQSLSTPTTSTTTAAATTPATTTATNLLVDNSNKEISYPHYATPKRTSLDHSYNKKCDMSSGIQPRKKINFASTPRDTINDKIVVNVCDEDDSNQVMEDSVYISDIEPMSESDYDPNNDTDTPTDLEDNSDTCQTEELDPMLKDKKFIVFEDNLNELMKFCPKCGKPVIEQSRTVNGSLLTYTLKCLDGCEYQWHSQPNITPHMPCGNLLLSAAMVVTGQSFTSMNAFASAMNLQFISHTSHEQTQDSTIFPVIQEQWKAERSKVVDMLKAKETLVLAGDARNDTPGHNATYGSYSLMDTDGNGVIGSHKIVCTELVRVTETTNSNNLEPAGLKRCLDQVKTKDKLSIPILATDRHVTVGSIMKKEHKDIQHQFDLWHLVKSVLKKLWAKSKQKGYGELAPWIQSISNHLWWCAANCEGSVQKLREMWLSILSHITNRHRFVGNQEFHHCAHGTLSDEETRKKKWMKTDSDVFKALQDIVANKLFLRDLQRVNLFCHTGQLEVFHSLLLKYAPKRQYFPYDAMKAKLYLAALDWNLQKCEKVVNEDGSGVTDIVSNKRSKKWVLRQRYRTTKMHVQPLMKRILHVKREGIILPKIENPGALSKQSISKIDKPNKGDMIMSSRFSTGS